MLVVEQLIKRLKTSGAAKVAGKKGKLVDQLGELKDRAEMWRRVSTAAELKPVCLYEFALPTPQIGVAAQPSIS